MFGLAASQRGKKNSFNFSFECKQFSTVYKKFFKVHPAPGFVPGGTRSKPADDGQTFSVELGKTYPGSNCSSNHSGLPIHLRMGDIVALSYIVGMQTQRHRDRKRKDREIWDYLLSQKIMITAEYLPGREDESGGRCRVAFSERCQRVDVKSLSFQGNMRT